jgi:hypothetical protein
VIHILGLAHKWRGWTSGASETCFLHVIWAMDVGSESDGRNPYVRRLTLVDGQQWRSDGRSGVSRQTHCVSVCRSHCWQPEGHGGDRRRAASFGVSTDASVGRYRALGALWSAFVDRWMLEHNRDRRVSRRVDSTAGIRSSWTCGANPLLATEPRSGGWHNGD